MGLKLIKIENMRDILLNVFEYDVKKFVFLLWCLVNKIKY